jgi:predicted transcriptional regulator
MEKVYTTKEVAEILQVSDRSVRRYLASYYTSNNGALQVSEKMLAVLKKEHIGQTEDTPDRDQGNEEGHLEFFTAEEYTEFHKRLSEYPYLKERIEFILNELDYHKKAGESQSKQMEIILQALQQRNYIEAKEKDLG